MVRLRIYKALRVEGLRETLHVLQHRMISTCTPHSMQGIPVLKPCTHRNGVRFVALEDLRGGLLQSPILQPLRLKRNLPALLQSTARTTCAASAFAVRAMSASCQKQMQGGRAENQQNQSLSHQVWDTQRAKDESQRF